MTRELVLGNARIVTRHETMHGTVHVSEGVIVGLGGAPTGVPAALDLEGDYLLPGLVELHTDVLERHAAPRPGVRWPAAPAVLAYDAQLAGAGITTALDSLPIGYAVDMEQRARDPRPLVDAIRATQEAGILRCEHFLHLRCEVGGELVVRGFEPFAGDPLVRLVSLMDHSPGQRQFVSVEKYREYTQGRYGLSDAQMDELIRRRRDERERSGDRHRAAIVALCQKRGLRLASHDDATRGHVEEAVQAGAVIAEFPTTVEAAEAAQAYGLAVVAGAPNLVCGRSHSGNVSVEELAGRGLLDILSSDYVPASALLGVFLLHAAGMALPEAVATATATPAQRVGLEDRGEISVGRLADLVQVRLVDGIPVVRSVWRRGLRIA